MPVAIRDVAGPSAPKVSHLRDLPAFAGVLLALIALALPWHHRRACPIFEGCGPWEPVTGWEAFGVVALVGLALALLAAAAIPGAKARRVVPATVCGSLAVVLALHEGLSSEVFAERQGPAAGFLVFLAGLAVAVAGWLASALTLPLPAPPAARSRWRHR